MKNTKKMNPTAQYGDFLCPLFAACSAVLVFTLYAPFALYLGNAEEFRFTLYNFWFVPILVFLFCFGLLFPAGVCLQSRFPRAGFVWNVVLFTFGILIYLQGSFLFEDTGVLNGTAYLAAEHREHIIKNTLLWISVLLAAIVFAVRTKKPNRELLTVFSGLFSAFVLVSLVLLLLGAKREYLLPKESFVSDRGLFDVSAQENAIVIVPDMFDRDYMENIYTESPDLLSDFSGFQWYRNVKGSFFSTRDSLTHFFQQETLFDTLEQKEYSFGIYTDERFLPHALQEKTVNILQEPAHINDLFRFTGVLYRLVACGYAPDILREAVWLYGNEFDGLYSPKNADYRMYTTSNTGFYGKLKEDGISIRNDSCFRLFHIYGAHYPYVMDEYLHPIQPSYSDENALGAARGTLRIIAAYMNRLKEAGVYDRSLIVIMADHGYVAPGLETDPLLMIHLPGKSGPFRITEEAILQEDFASLIHSFL